MTKAQKIARIIELSNARSSIQFMVDKALELIPKEFHQIYDVDAFVAKCQEVYEEHFPEELLDTYIELLENNKSRAVIEAIAGIQDKLFQAGAVLTEERFQTLFKNKEVEEKGQ